MRTTIIAVLAAGTVALAGCSAPAPAPEAVPTTTVAATSTRPSTPAPKPAATTATAVYKPGELRPQDRAYLANLNDWWRTADNATAIEGGELVCTRFNRGDDRLSILGDLIDVAGTENGVNLMHAAVMAYCPDQLIGVN